MAVPETRHARNGDVSIAFQVRRAAELEGVPGRWCLFAVEHPPG